MLISKLHEKNGREGKRVMGKGVQFLKIILIDWCLALSSSERLPPVADTEDHSQTIGGEKVQTRNFH